MLGTFQVAQWIKNLPAMQETQEMWVLSLGWEDPLEEGMATRSSILAWRIPMDREAWPSYSPWGHKKLDMTELIEQACTCKMPTMCQCSSGLWGCKG